MPLDEVDVRFLNVIQRYLLKYNGDAHPTVETLAKEVGVDRSTLIRHRHKLEQEGYLRIEPSTGRGNSNRYFLTERVAKGSQESEEGSQESVAKGGDATPVVRRSSKDLSTTMTSSRTTQQESVVVRPEKDSDPSPEAALRSQGFAPPRDQRIPGTATCWRCGVLVVTSRGDRLRGFRPDEAQPDVWQHSECPADSIRQCAACGLPVDPVDEWNDDDPPEARTSMAGWWNRFRKNGPVFVSHCWPDCTETVTNMMCHEHDVYVKAHPEEVG